MAQIQPIRPQRPTGDYRKDRPEADFDIVRFVDQFLARDDSDDTIIDQLIAAASHAPARTERSTQHIMMQSNQHNLHMSLGPEAPQAPLPYAI